MKAPEHDPLREVARRYDRAYTAVIVAGIVITVVCLTLYLLFS